MRCTIIFIALIVFAIFGYDIWVIFKYGNEESVSAHLLSMGEVIPQIPMLLGYIMGHLTTSRKVTPEAKKKMNKGSYTFWGVVGPAAAYDVYQVYFGSGLAGIIFKGKEFNQMVPFAICYLLGAYLWAMPKSKWSGRFKK